MAKKYSFLDYYQLRKNIFNNRKLNPVYLIFGEEVFLQHLIFNDFKKRLEKDNINVNYELVYGDNFNFTTFANSVRILPLGTQKNCVVIKEIEKIKTPLLKKLNSFISSLTLNDEKTLILFFSLQKKIPNGLDLEKIKQHGIISNLQKMNVLQIREWIKLKCKENNVKISTEAIYYLQRITGNELGVINNELDKIFCYLDLKSRNIEKEDILKTIYGSDSGNIFDFVDAIGEKRKDFTIISLRNILHSNEYHALQILKMINRQIKLILQTLKYKNNLNKLREDLSLPYFVVNKLVKQSNFYCIDECKKAFNMLQDAEIKIKTGYFDPALILEQLILKIIK